MLHILILFFYFIYFLTLADFGKLFKEILFFLRKIFKRLLRRNWARNCFSVLFSIQNIWVGVWTMGFPLIDLCALSQVMNWFIFPVVWLSFASILLLYNGTVAYKYFQVLHPVFPEVGLEKVQKVWKKKGNFWTHWDQIWQIFC